MNCGAVMEEQALGKSRLIVKSHSPVRSRVNWAIALLMMSSAIWLSFEYGRMQAGFFVLEAVETESGLRQQIADLTATSDGLRQQVAVLETSTRIDEEAYSQVEERLVELQQELAERQKDLNFYRGIMAPESQAEGLQIKEMNLLQLAEAKYFRLHLVLMQAINHSRIVSGRVRISVDGAHDGKSVTLDFSQLSRPGEEIEPIVFSFRYFQEFERELVLPEGFVAERINVEPVPSRRPSRAVRQSFDWKPQTG
ncbi:MAG: hypothetical protein O6946_01050 [Gammaproteobacteria bacterium]|nr:hypothetical protein [Gammaproteobacteria bacterium]MCZ6826356.1 hypothetical protein [Gammaproteobacteria bacterium]MCZ6911780.1 hypothetical protein [Pseudomonadota bacterium]